MRRVLYLSHPQVRIDPAIPVPNWSLSDEGRARVVALAAKGWPGPGWHIASSTETKAVETATLLAGASGNSLTKHAHMAEIDRSATGYVPHARHEALADALFANPAIGPEGWESASHAQSRIIAVFQQLMRETLGNVLMVGHGAVGTLLWCYLTNIPIARNQDQPMSGCIWSVDSDDGLVIAQHPWRAMEQIIPH